MTEPFVETETYRTKCKWVAKAFSEFGRSPTTIRALFYHALRRKEPDYPICGGFVGEIRIVRPYHESDGERLAKWARAARELGYLPEGAFLQEVAGACVIPPDLEPHSQRIELWLNRSAFNPLLQPICSKHGVTLVSVSGALGGAVDALRSRSQDDTTIILCLSDLSIAGFTFARDLALSIVQARGTGERDIRLKHTALTPEQVVGLGIPMVPGERGTKEQRNLYKRYLKPFGLDSKKMAELDALEVYHSGGIAGFVDDLLSKHTSASEMDRMQWLLDLKRGVLLEEKEIRAMGK